MRRLITSELSYNDIWEFIFWYSEGVVEGSEDEDLKFSEKFSKIVEI